MSDDAEREVRDHHEEEEEEEEEEEDDDDNNESIIHRLDPSPQEIREERESFRRMSHLITPPRQRPEESSATTTDSAGVQPGRARRGSSFMLERNDTAFTMLGDVTEQQVKDDNDHREEKKVNDDVSALVTPVRGRRFFKARAPVVSIPWNQIKRGSVITGDVALFYDDHELPRPPSMKLSPAAAAAAAAAVENDDSGDHDTEQQSAEGGTTTTTEKSVTPVTVEKVVVFNANSPEGCSLVKALAKTSQVIAAVRVFTSRTSRQLFKIPNVSVKVADGYDKKDLGRVSEGCTRAFLVTKYWERFESSLEERKASLILQACAEVQVPHLVFYAYEDAAELSAKGLKSQVSGAFHADGKNAASTPKFEGMKAVREEAKALGVSLTHMLTSYLDKEKSSKSLCLMMGDNGKLLVQPHFK